MKVRKILMLLSLVVFPGLLNLSIAQKVSPDSLQLQDTSRVAIQAQKISKALILLRDSITITLKSIQASQVNAKVQTKDKLNMAGHHLGLYKDKLDLDIQEVFTQTSKKGWTDVLIDRVSQETYQVRREYNRILKDIKGYLLKS